MQVNKRGERISLAGLVLQAALVGLALGIWWTTRSAAAYPALWLAVMPLPLWLWTLVLFYCRYLQRREEQELAQLAARGASESIFTDGRQARPAAGRVRFMETYLVPGFTVFLAVIHFVLGGLLLRWLSGGQANLPASNASGAFFFALGGAFAAFLFSRYATGLAKSESWQLLRAPGAYLFTNAVVFLLLAASFALEYLNSPVARKLVAYALPLFALVVGVELVLNFVLDLYRPRMPGVGQRFSYDSRLLNLISSPESIGHSIAEGLNYQFGFEVSSTWFYQLLQRAFVPLALTGVVILWLLSGVVVVDEGQQYVVLHWGRPELGRLLTPRAMPYLIWPWPIDQAQKFETGKVHQVVLGVGGARPEELVNGKRFYLWTKDHGDRIENDILVAVPPRRQGENTPSVNIIKMVVEVYYRVTDPYQYGYTVADAPRLIENLGYRELVKYAASATLDERLPAAGSAPARPQGLMSFGREQARKDLMRLISGAIAEQHLGVEVVDVQVLACHPPKDAAESFERVIAAERDQEKLRFAAQTYANKLLSEVAGSPELALELAQTIRMQQELEDLVSAEKDGQLSARLQQALAQATGEVEKLKKEVQNRRTYGKETAGGSRIAERLLTNQQQHLERLQQAGQDALKADLKGLLADARKRTTDLFSNVRGLAAVAVDEARTFRWKTELQERARAENFNVELLALRAAPSLYRMDKYLQVLSEGIQKQRKYLLGIDRGLLEIWLNLEQPAQSIGDIQFGKSQ